MVLNPLFVQSVCVFMYVPNDMHVFVGVCGCLWVFVGVCGCFVYILIPPRKKQDLSMFYIEGTGGASVTACVMYACGVMGAGTYYGDKHDCIGFDHINRNTPVLIRTPKLTRFEPA